jgi:transcriptional regulator with XRE-family HTH domain
MPPRERPVDRGDRRGRAIVAELGHEVRLARRQHGLTQAFLGQAVRLSGSEVGRIERGEIRSVSVSNLARLLSVVGLELSARAYPTGAPLRDKAQVGLLARFRSQLPAAFSWQTEVPVGLPGDLRAWDAVLGLGSAKVGIEAETRLVDLQAVERRIALKCRDSAVGSAILLLANTRTNRLTTRTFGEALQGSFPVPGVDALRALRAGRLPDGNAVILI